MTWTGRDSAARAIARTSHAFVETPSRSAAFSTARLEGLGEAQADPRRELFAGHARGLAGDVDEHELGLLAGEANLDVAGGQLRGQLHRRLREQVEQLQPQAGAECLGQPLRDLRRPLVAELSEVLEILLEALEHDGQIHDDVTMTSTTTSVKRHE